MYCYSVNSVMYTYAYRQEANCILCKVIKYFYLWIYSNFKHTSGHACTYMCLVRIYEDKIIIKAKLFFRIKSF